MALQVRKEVAMQPMHLATVELDVVAVADLADAPLSKLMS